MSHRRRFSQKTSPIRGAVPAVALVILTLAATELIACSIPVFRYALENWRPDPYVAVVLHRDELTDDQQSLIERMQTKEFDGTAAVNLVVKTVNVSDEPDESTAGLLEEHSDADLPRLILRKPGVRDSSETVFSADLSADAVTAVLESPLRTEITNRLIKGDSIVWVYLECGRPDEDDKKFTMLSEQLVRLQDEIELPEIEDEDLDELATDPELLQIRFSALRLSRDNVQESVFRDMLLQVEPDLMDAAYIDEPMAFPVFGRGRALYALVGDGLAPDLVEEACRFLTGACQCTVKAENPGVDLLMAVDWDRFIEPTEAVDASLPPLAGFTGFGSQADGDTTDTLLVEHSADSPGSEAPPQPDTAPASDPKPDNREPAAPTTDSDVSGDAEANPDQASPSVVRNVMYVLLLAAGAVVAVTLVMMRRTGG